VSSPLLANIYLHYVLDEWGAMAVGSRLKGRHILVRYADDFVMAFEDHLDAKRVFQVLGQRLARFGLTLHPDKSRFIDFRFRRPDGLRHPATSGTTFDFLGFTHVWGKSRNGKNVVRQVTAKGRFARALAAVSEWCQRNRHQSIRQQHEHLSAMLRAITATTASPATDVGSGGISIRSSGSGRSGYRVEGDTGISGGTVCANC
jgi:RNA-directed DNA polymerase